MVWALIRGGLLGGLLAFVWGALSWMVLPWHQHDMQAFLDEDTVAVTLRENAPKSGVYFLPGMGDGSEGARARAEARMSSGPVVFTAIRQEGVQSMTASMGMAFASQVLIALLLTWLVLQAGIENYGGRLLYVGVFAVAGALLAMAPGWIWLGFSVAYTLIGMLDIVVSWLLAGVVIAWAAKP